MRKWFALYICAKPTDVSESATFSLTTSSSVAVIGAIGSRCVGAQEAGVWLKSLILRPFDIGLGPRRLDSRLEIACLHSNDAAVMPVRSASAGSMMVMLSPLCTILRIR